MEEEINQGFAPPPTADEVVPEPKAYERPKNKHSLIWGVIAVAVIILGGFFVFVYSGDGVVEESRESIKEDYVSIINLRTAELGEYGTYVTRPRIYELSEIEERSDVVFIGGVKGNANNFEKGIMSLTLGVTITKDGNTIFDDPSYFTSHADVEEDYTYAGDFKIALPTKPYFEGTPYFFNEEGNYILKFKITDELGRTIEEIMNLEVVLGIF